jgi:hypothetical protein
MKTDDFEKRLRQQALRKIPGEWRAEILDTTKKQPCRAVVQTSWSPLNLLFIPWRELIWPSRRVWSGIAAAWVVIVAVNHHDSRNPGLAGHTFTPPSPAVLMAWREQELSLTDFAEPRETRGAGVPKKAAPAPHSEWHNQFLQA